MDTARSSNSFRAYHPQSPLRVPWWRWGWAHFVLEHKLRVRRAYRDAWFDRTLKYARALRRLENPEHPRLARLDPALFAACRLKEGDPRTIFELELRVLCDQPYVQIAECSGVTPEVIVAYEHVFYDMRSMLGVARAVLNRIQYARYLPFLRGDLENMIRT